MMRWERTKRPRYRLRGIVCFAGAYSCFCWRRMRMRIASSVYCGPKLRSRTKRSLPGGRTAMCFTPVLTSYPISRRARRKAGKLYCRHDSLIHIPADRASPCRPAFLFHFPFHIVFCLPRIFGLDNGKGVFPAKFIRCPPHERIARLIVVIPFPVLERHGIEHKMIMNTLGIEMCAPQ